MHPYFLIIISVVLGACGQVVLKMGTLKLSVAGLSLLEQFVKYFTSLPILAGLLLYTLSAVVWVFAIARVQLSIAYPMVASGYVLVVLLSYLLLHEPVSGLRILGLLIIVTGVIIIANS
ncbi:Drug/metabolite transporter [Syntrophomonas zehnderi OL-4]|uniref:Drug/metabolite transporter n=1 Tax=Syntrophomonas zehnderi OL-4 TaxID=690567 RepID=A0A0E4C7T6_9FIRM|nr:EamA family transporter [Syntrophomonas zehnderi]CFX11270.1 Drug/metabolite transporter [Syntrophomonas zehnderi OL-4]